MLWPFKEFFMTKKNMSKKFQNIMVFEKKRKKIFFRKTWLPTNPEYPENRETSEIFFTDSFLKLKSLKKIQKLICQIHHVP